MKKRQFTKLVKELIPEAILQVREQSTTGQGGTMVQGKGMQYGTPKAFKKKNKQNKEQEVKTTYENNKRKIYSIKKRNI